jgi:protein phosphatase
MACERLRALSAGSAGKEDLRDAIVDADLSIAARSVEEPYLLGMGTTLTSALVRDGVMTVGHVGDSRAYLMHEGVLRQLTDDHSWVGEMVRRGELTPAEAAVHPHRSVITKALGTEGDIEPDLLEIFLEPGDRVLLCSDGLSGMVSDEQIGDVLRRPDDVQAIAEALVAAALANGGEDNVTVVVLELTGDDVSEPDPQDSLDDDEVVLGPVDRGEAPVQMTPDLMRPATGVRARLGRRASPLVRRASRTADVGETTAQAGARWSRRKWIITVVLVIVVLALAIAAFAVFNSNVYYVGTANGIVALYQGLPASVLGIELSSVVELGTVRYDSLEQYLKERVDAHELVAKEDGQAFLRGLAALP